MAEPFFPDIFQGVVERVNAAFSSRASDPFEVLFEKGNHAQTQRSVYSTAPKDFQMVWLKMPFIETKTDWRTNSEVRCEVWIIKPTDPKYTEQQREDVIYKPRLLPICDVLIQELKRERWFQFATGEKVQHTRLISPYWGHGDVNGSDINNLFKLDVDAIFLMNLKLVVKRQNCGSPFYPLNTNTNYPLSPYILSFFEDMELVVDGGNENDPVSNSPNVVIPFLLGKEFSVYQRGVGPLRKKVNIEFIPDAENGGFAFTNEKTFSPGDTYTIKIRPTYVENVIGLNGTTTSGSRSTFIEKN